MRSLAIVLLSLACLSPVKAQVAMPSGPTPLEYIDAKRLADAERRVAGLQAPQGGVLHGGVLFGEAALDQPVQQVQRRPYILACSTCTGQHVVGDRHVVGARQAVGGVGRNDAGGRAAQGFALPCAPGHRHRMRPAVRAGGVAGVCVRGHGGLNRTGSPAGA